MLLGGTDPELVRLYRERIVKPRRRRLTAILERGVSSGERAADADIEVATTMLTGSWYAAALAGSPPPPDWAERTAALTWAALGRSRQRSGTEAASGEMSHAAN